MGRRRKFDERRVAGLFRFIDNGGICVYCGVRSTTKDHFAPVSVVSSLIGLESPDRQYLIPACGECNCIAGSRMFVTVAAKRRYIQQRLSNK